VNLVKWRDLSLQEKIDYCKEILKSYCVDCQQRREIEKQIKQYENSIKKINK